LHGDCTHLTVCSDDDEEDAAAVTEAAKEGDEAEEEAVKMDIHAPPKPDPYQFHWYTPEELDGFSQRQLLADVALYEGMFTPCTGFLPSTQRSVIRTGKNCKAKPGRPQAISQKRTRVPSTSPRPGRSYYET
jgi:hypothetical protein